MFPNPNPRSTPNPILNPSLCLEPVSSSEKKHAESIYNSNKKRLKELVNEETLKIDGINFERLHTYGQDSLYGFNNNGREVFREEYSDYMRR